MIKKLILLIQLLFLTLILQSQSITIGPISGPSNYLFGPIYRFSAGTTVNYSRYAYLYTSSDLNLPIGCKITKLEWIKANNNTVIGNNTFNVRIGNKIGSSLTTDDYDWTGLLEETIPVYSSNTLSILGGIGSTINIPFDTTFYYDGDGLLITTDWIKYGVSNGALNFFVQSSLGKSIGAASNTQFINDNCNLSPNTFGNSRPTIKIYYTPLPPCNSLPLVSNIIPSIIESCPGQQFKLSLETKPEGSEVSYQWESSLDSLFNNPVIIGNSSTVSLTQVTSTYYRCKINCLSSGFVYSNIIKMNMSPFYNCYCISKALSTADEEIEKVIIGNVINKSGCDSTGTGYGSIQSLYSNYKDKEPLIAEVGSENLIYIKTKVCSFNNYPNKCNVYIDYNHNGSFSDPGELVYIGPTYNGDNERFGTFIIPQNTLLGLTGIRVVLSEQNQPINSSCGTYSFGETEDYLINIIPTTVCNIPIIGNIIVQDSVVCKNSSTILTLSNTITGNNISYQWFKNYVQIPGATLAYYQPIIMEESVFDCVATCNISNVSVEPAQVTVKLKNFLDCYCKSMAGAASDASIFSFKFNGVLNTSVCYAGSNCEGSIPDRYTNWKCLGSLTTVNNGYAYNFDIESDDCDQAPYYYTGSSIWIDYNQDGIFSSSEKAFSNNEVLGPTHILGSLIIPTSAKTGVTMMRVLLQEGISANQAFACGNYSSGETEDYLITINSPYIQGDFNQDGLVNYADLIILENAINNYEYGPDLVTDLNKDGNVDLLDLVIFENIIR